LDALDRARSDDQNVHMVVDDLGRSGRIWPEADFEGTDLETVSAICFPGSIKIPSW
jgi:hypothetical protein